MNASVLSLLAASLSVLGGGCAPAPDGTPVRIIEIRAVQTEPESSGHAGLSATVATNLFHDVASRLGSLGYVIGYFKPASDPTRPTWVEYAFQFTPKDAYTVDLTMDIDGKYVTFRGHTYFGEPDVESESVAALQKSMKLCQEFLDACQIKYEVRTYTNHLYFLKS